MPSINDSECWTISDGGAGYRQVVDYMDDIIMIISLCILFCFISVARFLSRFFFFFRALLRARLIGGLGLWLFLCFSLHYSSHSFAFLQVHYHSMITRRSSIHGGSNVYKNMVRCLLLESQAQKTEIFMMVFFLCCFSSSFCASYFARWPVGLSSASVVSLLYWYGKTRHTYSSQIKACTFTVSPSPPNVYISRFSAHKTFIELFDSIVHDTFKHAF